MHSSYPLRPAASLAVAFGFFLAGCAPSGQVAVERPSSEQIPSWSPYGSIRAGLDHLLPDTLFPPASVGMKIVSLRTGETLYALHADEVFLPASNEKLLTSAAALSTLGEGYLFATRVFVDTTGTARIYLKGSGDPQLTTADIDSLARQIATLLPPGRHWTLCADISLFDDVPWGKGWMWDDEPSTDAMFISPLSVNGNSLRVKVTPASEAGAKPVVTLDPPTAYAPVECTAVTVDDSVARPLEISRNWQDRSNTITVKGEILRSASAATGGVSVRDPAWYALTLFRESLASQGVVGEGLLSDTVPSTATELGCIERRLDTVVTKMNKVSDNLSAENLLRTISVRRFGPPGTDALGVEAILEFLAGRGIDTTAMVIADGSGVSRYNYVSPRILVRLLEAMAQDSTHRGAWMYALPIAGVDGTLKDRMKGTEAEQNLRAKTGTLDGVTSLSGYVSTADGEPLAFSIMMQGIPARLKQYRQVQDRIGSFLSGLRRRNF